MATFSEPFDPSSKPGTLFQVGEHVYKVKGYPYPGIVVAAFYNTKGQVRYVIEATGADYEGMLHIFSEEQLARQ
jgi:hypothetical protein